MKTDVHVTATPLVTLRGASGSMVSDERNNGLVGGRKAVTCRLARPERAACIFFSPFRLELGSRLMISTVAPLPGHNHIVVILITANILHDVHARLSHPLRPSLRPGRWIRGILYLKTLSSRVLMLPTQLRFRSVKHHGRLE